jgi:hypothetical protein
MGWIVASGLINVLLSVLGVVMALKPPKEKHHARWIVVYDVGLITAAHRLTPEVQGLFRLARLLPM